MTHEFKKYNVTIDQWILLNRLFKDKEISQTTLAKRSNKDLPTVTRMLDLMEKKELIIKSEDPNDSRAYLILLTEFGSTILESLNLIAAKIEDELLEVITKKNKEIFKETLDTIINEYIFL
ncbi:MAG: MarR family winged helix-turn-helix transcriptional regulator [Sarcina sp.]